MLLSRTIQYKALLLLTVFAANFFVVCHCSARAARPAERASCCSKKEEKQPPCKDGNECGGMHAMKFNLLEKQTAKEITASAQTLTIVSTQFIKMKKIFMAVTLFIKKEIGNQREHFAALSTNMMTLAKGVRLSEEAIYEDYCPMKKVTWLSNDPAIKNPYYGNSMLTCGNVKTTIKP